MNMKKTIIILILINLTIISAVELYVYTITPHYGDTNYNGTTIKYIPMNTTDGSIYGFTEFSPKGTTVTIYVTGNDTEDQATFYHEMYHVMHPEQGDNDVAAEEYSVKMVKGYVSKQSC